MLFGVWGRDSAGEEQGGLGWEFAQPFSAQPAAEDMGEQEGPALVDGPSLRNGVEPMQGVADHGDGFAMMVAVVKPRVEVPPVVEQRDGSPALPTPSCPFRFLGGWPSAGRAPAFG